MPRQNRVSMDKHYILADDGMTPLAIEVWKDGELDRAALVRWGQWFEAIWQRRLITTTVGLGYGPMRYFISTVFLGLDHSFPLFGADREDQSPVLWETMVFNAPIMMMRQRLTRRFGLFHVPRQHRRRFPKDPLQFDEQQDRYTSPAPATSRRLSDLP